MKVRVNRYARRRRKRESIVVRGDPVLMGRSDWEARKGRPQVLPEGAEAISKTAYHSGVETMLEDIKHGGILSGSPVMEAIVDTLDDLLEFNVVPPTVLRLDDKGIASYQELVPNARKFWYMSDLERIRVNRRDLIKIAVIDIIVHQEDRHGGNLLVTPDWHAWAIDNEQAFGDGVDSIAVDMTLQMKIPSDILRKLKNVQKEDFVTALAGIPKAEVKAAWNRKMRLEQTKTIEFRTL